jgi:hypothetical protein
MKRIIVPVVAALLFAGAANAQVAQKTPAKTKATVSATKPASSVTSVSPKSTSTTTTATKTATPIRRKHHKAHKAVPKKGK